MEEGEREEQIKMMIDCLCCKRIIEDTDLGKINEEKVQICKKCLEMAGGKGEQNGRKLRLYRSKLHRQD